VNTKAASSAIFAHTSKFIFLVSSIEAMDSKDYQEKELASDAVLAGTSQSSQDDPSSIEWDAADEKRIRNRMDWRIMPTVFLLYILCFIDR